MWIGADGIHSPVREQMLGTEKPIFTGNVAWRAVVPIAALGAHAPRPTACAWMGPGKHCVTYRLRRGTLANFVGVIERDDWTTESWTERGTREEALADFADWHPTITRLLGEADELYRWALFDRAPLPRWVDGRVAILGDAAHPMYAFAWRERDRHARWKTPGVLARQVTQKSVSRLRGLEAYQHSRQARAGQVRGRFACQCQKYSQTAHGPVNVATYGPMWLARKIYAPHGCTHRRQEPVMRI